MDSIPKISFPVGVVGLGLMGSSIFTCLLAAGHEVIGVDKDENVRTPARQRIQRFLDELKHEGLFNGDVSAALKRMTITTELHALKPCNLVIEAIYEDLKLKKKVIDELEAVVDDTVVIGTNTSAIPITQLQDKMKQPGRLIGIHWAEPAHISRFMEIICGDYTDPDVGRKVKRWAEGWGKEPSLLLKEIRGFITNRIMYAMLREAFYLVENDVCTIEDIDRSLRNDHGYWMTLAGPFRFMDLTGIPAYGAVMKDLNPELSNSKEVPKLMQEIIEQGAKGTQNARGFYSYTPETAKEWDKTFIRFSYDIRRLASKYNQRS